MVITPELIKQHIDDIPNRTDSDLQHLFKCSSSHGGKLMKPYELAIAKERKKRGTSKYISEQSIEEQVAEYETKEAYLNGETNDK